MIGIENSVSRVSGVEQPSYLLRIAPEVYEEERRRVASRFDEAVRLAEQAFASEFSRLLSHLTGRLGKRGEWRAADLPGLRSG